MTAIPGSKFERGHVEVFGYRISFAQAGSGDAIVSLPDSAGLEMSTAKDALAVSNRVIEGAGHDIQNTAPEAFVESVSRLIG